MNNAPKIIILTETSDLDFTIHTAPALVEVKKLCTGYLRKFKISRIEETETPNGNLEITLHLKKVKNDLLIKGAN